MDRIEIRGLRLRCVIGIEEWERKTQQEVRVDVSLTVDLRAAGTSDDLADTINYKTIAKGAQALAESSSFRLVEALAEAIAGLCLKDERVEEAEVSVRKPGALRFTRTVGVTIRRRRPSRE
ncbi:MAG: dihydroneopterin aldolase [Magnetococcales bacterium]|nr:dihydroneopterin aldolase [Magnetococcales bacterium]